MISAVNQIAIKKIQESKELLNILSTIEKETSLLEALMFERLKLFFISLESQVIELVGENELLTIHNLVDDLIADNFEDYYEIISKYNKKAMEHGFTTTTLLTDHVEASLKWFSLKTNVVVDMDNLFKPSARVNEIIQLRSFQASEKTMTRINGNINKVLQDSYNEGWGVPKTTANLKNEFNKLKTWEAHRIARTEINSAKNTASYQQLLDDNIEYHQWWSASDSDVRDSHIELHSLITKVGNHFPNDLLYPGDRSGDISEWINCRCTSLPFIVPYNMMVPPGMSVFRESDLIKIDEKVINIGTVRDFERFKLNNDLQNAFYKSRSLKIHSLKNVENSFISYDDVLKGFDRLPRKIQNEIKHIYIIDKYNIHNKKVILGHSSMNHDFIILYKSERSINYYTVHVIPHEAGHVATKLISVEDYINAIAKDLNKNIRLNRQLYPSDYAKESHLEDIAEFLPKYLNAPEFTKQLFEHRYEVFRIIL